MKKHELLAKKRAKADRLRQKRYYERYVRTGRAFSWAQFEAAFYAYAESSGLDDKIRDVARRMIQNEEPPIW